MDEHFEQGTSVCFCGIDDTMADRQRVGCRIVLVSLRIPALKTIVLGDGVVDLDVPWSVLEARVSVLIALLVVWLLIGVG